MKKDTYFSVGFGTTMVDCDMVVFQGQGADGLVTDRWSVGYGVPMLDLIQDYKWSSSLDGSSYSFLATRKLDTGDKNQDWVIPLNEKFPMIWAENTLSSRLEMHTSYGSFEALLTQTVTESTVEKKRLVDGIEGEG